MPQDHPDRPDDNADPRTHARWALTASRKNVNSALDQLAAIAADPETSDDDKTAVALVANVLSAVYGPLSAIAWCAVALVDAADYLSSELRGR